MPKRRTPRLSQGRRKAGVSAGQSETQEPAPILPCIAGLGQGQQTKGVASSRSGICGVIAQEQSTGPVAPRTGLVLEAGKKILPPLRGGWLLIRPLRNTVASFHYSSRTKCDIVQRVSLCLVLSSTEGLKGLVNARSPGIVPLYQRLSRYLSLEAEGARSGARPPARRRPATARS